MILLTSALMRVHETEVALYWYEQYISWGLKGPQ
jgi:hypothetical protein